MSYATASYVHIRARRAGFFSDVISVAIRALRSIPRDPEAIYPALVIPVFFYAINVGALQDVAERIPGLDYKAFQLPVAIIFAVTGISRAVTLVTDIQTGYFDRLAMTPGQSPGAAARPHNRRLHAGRGADLTGDRHRVRRRRYVRLRSARTSAVHPAIGPLGPGVHGLPVRDRAEDGQSGGRELQLPPLLPLRLSHDGVRSRSRR